MTARTIVASCAAALVTATAAPAATFVAPGVPWSHITTCLRTAGGYQIARAEHVAGQPPEPWLGGASFPPRADDLGLVWQLIVRNGNVIETQVSASWAPAQDRALTNEVRDCFKPYNPKPLPGQTAIFLG